MMVPPFTIRSIPLLILLLLPSISAEATETATESRPINDKCKNATEIVNFPIQLSGDLFTASRDKRNLTSCGVEDGSKGVWYRIGRDTDAAQSATTVKATLTASLVASSKTIGSQFSLGLLRAYQTRCNDLDCMNPNEYTRQLQEENSITWFAGYYQSYYLYVAAPRHALASNYTAFTIQFEEIPMDYSAHSGCGNPLPLELNKPVNETAANVAPHGIDLLVTPCRVTGYSRGRLYRVNGTGSDLKIRVVIQSAAAMNMAVFANSGGQLCSANESTTCVANSWLAASDGGIMELTFSSIDDSIYLVSVSGQTYDDLADYQIELLKSDSGKEMADSELLSSHGRDVSAGSSKASNADHSASSGRRGSRALQSFAIASIYTATAFTLIYLM